MRKAATMLVLAGLAVMPAWGSNIYSVNYEGDALPETQPGWHRAYGGGGAIRTIHADPDDPNNHFLVINSLASQMIQDWAWYPRQMDPGAPQERFYALWRILVVEQHGYPEHGVAFAADNGNIVGLEYGFDHVYDAFQSWSAPIEPGVFHTYRVESDSMVSYRLWIDGELVHEGPFFEGLLESYAAFGDGVQGGGARSLVKYDFFRFGVELVPEPTAIMSLMGVCAWGRPRRGQSERR